MCGAHSAHSLLSALTNKGQTSPALASHTCTTHFQSHMLWIKHALHSQSQSVTIVTKKQEHRNCKQSKGTSSSLLLAAEHRGLVKMTLLATPHRPLAIE